MKSIHIIAMTLSCLAFVPAQGADVVRSQELESGDGQQVAVREEAKQSEHPVGSADYDLSPLPEDLRSKVESYLAEQGKLEKEISRLDAMTQASSNAWAQQRATGMATKLNYELKNLRLKRREIIRDYRELLRSGWTPPDSMENFESLFFPGSGSNS